jgi:hypothetical protein
MACRPDADYDVSREYRLRIAALLLPCGRRFWEAGSWDCCLVWLQQAFIYPVRLRPLAGTAVSCLFLSSLWLVSLGA